MNEEQILETIEKFAEKHPYYKAIHEALMATKEKNPEDYRAAINILVKKNFPNKIALLLFLSQ